MYNKNNDDDNDADNNNDEYNNDEYNNDINKLAQDVRGRKYNMHILLGLHLI